MKIEKPLLVLITLCVLLTFCTKSKLSKKDAIPNGKWEWVYSTKYYYKDTVLDVSTTEDMYTLEISNFLEYKLYKNETKILEGNFGELSEYNSDSYTPSNQSDILIMRYSNSLLYVTGGCPFQDFAYTNVYKLKP